MPTLQRWLVLVIGGIWLAQRTQAGPKQGG
jgi:hypothetical protein